MEFDRTKEQTFKQKINHAIKPEVEAYNIICDQVEICYPSLNLKSY